MAEIVSILHFELSSPDRRHAKKPHMKPLPHTYLLREVLADIDGIIGNNHHEQVFEIHQSQLQYRKLKCCLWLLFPWLLVLSAAWGSYIFYLCEEYFDKSTDECLPLDYEGNLINLIAWGTFLLSFIISCVLFICGNCRYSRSSHRISAQWRQSIQREIEDHIAVRRQQSPQWDFNVTYTQWRRHMLSGKLTIRKINGHDRSRQSQSVHHLNVGPHVSVPSKSTDITQVYDHNGHHVSGPQGPHLAQNSREMMEIQEMAQQNQLMLEALYHDGGQQLMMNQHSQVVADNMSNLNHIGMNSPHNHHPQGSKRISGDYPPLPIHDHHDHVHMANGFAGHHQGMESQPLQQPNIYKQESLPAPQIGDKQMSLSQSQMRLAMQPLPPQPKVNTGTDPGPKEDMV